MKKQMTFRIKPKFKTKIAHLSIDQEKNQSYLINHIIDNWKADSIILKKLAEKSKLSKENRQVAYQIESKNREKILATTSQYDISNSQLLNHILEEYFDTLND